MNFTICRAAWAKLIYRVYEVDPLKCINGDQAMRSVALIHDPAVIRRILEHLEPWDPEPMQRAPPEDPEAAEPPDWPAKSTPSRILSGSRYRLSGVAGTP